MRRWHALPVAALVAFVTAAMLFGVANPHGASAIGGVVVEIDCDTSTGAVDDTCSFPSGTTTLTVNVVLTNGSGATIDVAGLNFDVLADQLLLDPPAGVDTDMNSNPNFSESGVGSAGSWACTPPPADNDTNPADPNIADSFLSCFTSTLGPDVLAGDSLLLATVTYNAADGASFLTLTNVGIGDFVAGATLVDCSDNDCLGASIGIGVAPPVDTPTPTATATNTNTPTATNTPCQTGCPTSTSLAYVTVTPTPGPETPTAAAGGGETTVPTTAPGGGATPPPTGGTGAGGRPITLPDTGSGGESSMNWAQFALLTLVALAAGGVAGGAYLGAAVVSRRQR